MSISKNLTAALASLGIAALCFGYFAAYIPYSMMTKMITEGLFAGMDGHGFNGFVIQPVVVLASSLSMFIFLTAAGWWKYATHSTVMGVSLPRPQWFTFVSGLCTAGQIITTTLAYTFSGISIVFAMLLMRGGVLVMAPVVDLVVRRRRRKIYWPSWVAAGLSLMALFVGFAQKAGMEMTLPAAINIGIYLGVYFFRLYFMSGRAKSDDADERKRYFTEEQMVANVVLFAALFVIGFLGRNGAPESMAAQFWQGFVWYPFQGFFVVTFLIGVFSYGTGLFGSLIFLDKRENTFTVPANRASSIMAGLVASYLLAVFYGKRFPSTYELVGAALIIGAILFLMMRTMTEKRKAARKAKNHP